MEIKVKDEYLNLVMTKRFVGIGNIKLDTNRPMTQDKMLHYMRNGFSEVFEYVTPVTEPEVKSEPEVKEPETKPVVKKAGRPKKK